MRSISEELSIRFPEGHEGLTNLAYLGLGSFSFQEYKCYKRHDSSTSAFSNTILFIIPKYTHNNTNQFTYIHVAILQIKYKYMN